MQLFAPDILLDARGLSAFICVTGFLLGLMLWLTGWMCHRFWVVLATTVTAGVVGLRASPANHVQPLVAALLLALAAGVLALALIRVIAFLSSGVAACLAVRALVSVTWIEPIICFMAGGLAGLYFFRIWTRAWTSFAGTLLMGYSGLCLADRLGKLDAILLAEQRTTLLNFACGGMVLAGVGAQVFVERRREEKKRKREEETKKMAEEKLKQLYASNAKKQKSWWSSALGKLRKAG